MVEVVVEALVLVLVLVVVVVVVVVLVVMINLAWRCSSFSCVKLIIMKSLKPVITDGSRA